MKVLIFRDEFIVLAHPAQLGDAFEINTEVNIYKYIYVSTLDVVSKLCPVLGCHPRPQSLTLGHQCN